MLAMLLERPGGLVTREELRQRLWSRDTFVDFDQGLNAAVKRLRVTLGDSAESPRFIETVPRRGYRFIAPASFDPRANGVRGDSPRFAARQPARWHAAWVGMAIVLGIAVGGALALGWRALLKSPGQTSPLVRAASEPERGAPVSALAAARPLTSGPDFNAEPALSPDGKWVAFASDRAGEGHLDIWMQGLGGGEPVRLTRDEADEREPSFSADGSRIAFRSERSGGGIYVIAAHVGAEAKLLVTGDAYGARFSPDGRWLAYSRSPVPYGTDRDTAYFCHTYLIPATGAGAGAGAAAAGTPARLLPDFVSVTWPVWSPDSRRLLVTARRRGEDTPAWWTVGADGEAPAPISGIDAFTGLGRFPVRPWCWIEGDRVVYSASLGDDIWDLWEVGIAATWRTLSSAPKRLTTSAGSHAAHATIARGRDLVFVNLSRSPCAGIAATRIRWTGRRIRRGFCTSRAIRRRCSSSISDLARSGACCGAPGSLSGRRDSLPTIAG